MAMICRNGVRECDGCMNCEEMHERVGNCEHCSDTIYNNEPYYDFDGVFVHDDCLIEYAHRFRKGF